MCVNIVLGNKLFDNMTSEGAIIHLFLILKILIIQT